MIEILRSRLVDLPHGFPTRTGGVSKGGFSSLNLGFSVGDERAAVEENLARVAREAGFANGSLHVISQIHGARVVEAKGSDSSAAFRPAYAEADAHWTEEAGAALGIRVADCVPLLLIDPVGKRVAAVHSGWKGTEAEIAARSVEALVARGSKPTDVVAVLGPHIKRCCYEVSEELAAKFEGRFGAACVRREKPTPHLDLAYAVTTSLTSQGVRAEHVDVLPHCTHCDAARFFSHRRDKGVTGRHMGFVVCRFRS